MVGGARRLGVRERLLHEDHAFGKAARQRIRAPKKRGRDVKKDPNLGDPAQFDGALERLNGLGNGAPAEKDEAQAPVD